MSLENIRLEFTTTIELILKEKEQAINKLSGAEKANAKFKHLDDMNTFAGLMNTKINEIMANYGELFQTDEQFNQFYNFIKPTFEKLHNKYIAIGKPF